MILGGINFAEMKGLTSMPQNAASAWGAVENLIGANYTALLYVGSQVVKGTNYHFIAEQTLLTKEPEKHIVKIAVNDFHGVYTIATVEVIF